jgi:O-antigen/teichoic acid export membrane protein
LTTRVPVKAEVTGARIAAAPAVVSGRSGVKALISNASSMFMTSIITSGFGVIFWWVAARQYAPSSVGVGAAAVSASQFLATLATLGFGTLLIGELPHVPLRARGSLVATALLVCAAVGGALGIASAYLGPLLVGDLRPLAGDGTWLALFSLAVGSMAVGFVVDQVCAGELRSELALVRNSIYAIAKLLALAAAALWLQIDSGLIVFATWPLANLLALAWLFQSTSGISEIRMVGRPRRSALHGLGWSALGHHALNLSIQAPALALPVIVTALLSAEQNAYFYTAWMIASVAGLPQTSLATTLYAVGVREPDQLAKRTRVTLLLGTCIGLAALVSILVAGDWVLRIFGRSYADQASLTLRLLAISVLPLMIKNHYIALRRTHKKILSAGIVVGIGAIVELTAAGIGARIGDIPGLSIGWLIGLSLEVAWMLPTVLAVIRGRGPAPAKPAFAIDGPT